jgi:hypothetical protein
VTVVSVVAVCRLAERHVRGVGEPVPVEQIVARLESYGIDRERGRAGCRLAVVVGRLTETTDAAGHRCLRVPAKAAA